MEVNELDTVMLPYRKGSTNVNNFKKIQEAIEKGHIHKLMKVLKQMPPPNYKDNKQVKGIIVSNSQQQKQDGIKLVQLFYTKGLKSAEKYYEKHFKNLPPDPIEEEGNESEEVLPTEETQPDNMIAGPIITRSARASNDYITPLEQMLIHDTSKMTTEIEEEEIYEEIKHIGEKREKEHIPGVSQLEVTTEEIKKGVSDANVAIEDNFSHLQNFIKSMMTKTNTTVKSMEDQMSQLQEAVHAVQDEMQKKTEKIHCGVNQLLDDTDNMRSQINQTEEFNEYIYYRVFTIVSRAVGIEIRKWEELLRILLDGYPNSFMNRIIYEIQMEHPSEIDMTYDCLTRWKLYNSSTKDRLPALTKALNKLGLKYVVKDINELLKQYNKETKTDISATIKDDILKDLGKEIGDEYLTVGNFLDVSPAKLTKLQEQKDQAYRNYIMLLEWRDKQESYTSTALAKLTGALKNSDRIDLIDKLADCVDNHMTAPPKTEIQYDIYLTPVQVNKG